MAGNNQFNQRMQELWERYLPQQLLRLQTISRAVTALESGELDSNLQNQAAADAHKLAGSLGSFGLHEASEIAQVIEAEFTSITTNQKVTSTGLRAALVHLCLEIESKYK